jgi:hypothetical protein
MSHKLEKSSIRLLTEFSKVSVIKIMKFAHSMAWNRIVTHDKKIINQSFKERNIKIIRFLIFVVYFLSETPQNWPETWTWSDLAFPVSVLCFMCVCGLCVCMCVGEWFWVMMRELYKSYKMAMWTVANFVRWHTHSRATPAAFAPCVHQ